VPKARLPTEQNTVTGKTGKQSGFTYIALLIAVAILSATLAAVAEVAYTMVQRDREKELIFVGHQFRQAINSYYASNRRYPKQLQDLLLDNQDAGVKRYLRKIFVDPVTGNADWGLVKIGDDEIIGVHSLSEAEPIKKAGFRPIDIDLADREKYSEWIFMAKVRRGAVLRTTTPPASKPFFATP
jgi:type II secretory pathway pseudopilin PulG